MLYEGEHTVNIDVFELAVAQHTAIYSVFEPAVKKHCNLRRFQQRGRQKRCYLRGFFTFSCKDVKPRQFTKTLQKPMFLPSKNGENCRPNSSEIAKSGAPAARQET